jgi:hypothetical protein
MLIRELMLVRNDTGFPSSESANKKTIRILVVCTVFLSITLVTLQARSSNTIFRIKLVWMLLHFPLALILFNQSFQTIKQVCEVILLLGLSSTWYLAVDHTFEEMDVSGQIAQTSQNMISLPET